MDPIEEALAGIRQSVHDAVTWARSEGMDPVYAVESVLRAQESAPVTAGTPVINVVVQRPMVKRIERDAQGQIIRIIEEETGGE